MNIFLNSKHELRSGWKFGGFVLLFIVLAIFSAWALSPFFPAIAEDSLTLIVENEVPLFIGAVGALLVMVRFVDRRPLATFGVGLPPFWKRHFLLGVAIAAGMLAAFVLGSFVFGHVTMAWSAFKWPAGTVFFTFLLLMLAAASEELVFRGFPLQVLSEGMGTWPAVILMSALFGLVHMENPNASFLGTVNTILAGILLSLAYVKTRSLWLPYGIHVGWNVGLGFVFGFPLSGINIASLWTTGVTGSDTIIGGNYGPEGGLLATFIFAGSAVFVQKGMKK